MFEVQTYTVFDGWINCWEYNDCPLTFGSKEEAQAAIDEFFNELPDYMAVHYTRDDYRIVESKESA